MKRKKLETDKKLDKMFRQWDIDEFLQSPFIRYIKKGFYIILKIITILILCFFSYLMSFGADIFFYKYITSQVSG